MNGKQPRWKQDRLRDQSDPMELGQALRQIGGMCCPFLQARDDTRLFSKGTTGGTGSLPASAERVRLPRGAPIHLIATEVWVTIIAVLTCLVPSNATYAQDPLEHTVRKGPVEATVGLEPADSMIGDSISLRLRVVAEKGVELLMPEFGQALERFTIFDFKSDEKIDDEGRTVAIQSYQLQPPRSGPQSIPPIMVEFVDRRDGAKPAPDGLDAYELLTERLSFDVQSVLPKDAAAELNPPLGKLATLDPSDRTTWPWIIVVLATIATAPFAWQWWMTSRRKARRRSAYDISMSRLKRLMDQTAQSPEQMDAFFVELSGVVRWYLENRFDLRAPELTTEEFLELMSQSPDLSGDHQSLLRDFLRRADLVKFAHFMPSTNDIDESVAAARRFLEETRLDAPLADHDGAGAAQAEVARV